MAKNAIGLAVACDEYGASFFANGAAPSAVLEYPGTIKNPERIREAWHRAYGNGNAHKVAVLEEGMKYTPISIHYQGSPIMCSGTRYSRAISSI